MDWLQALPLPAMFLVSFAATLATALISLFLVRASLRSFGYGPEMPFPLRDAVVTTTSAMFALMVAFSAAGVWSEANQARAAVQREANALENLRSIAQGFPSALRERALLDVKGYAKQVLEVDWPAMVRKVHFTDSLYDESEKVLIDLIEAVARASSAGDSLPGASAAIGQIVEVRSARLQRITLATQGITRAQWLAMLLIGWAAIIALAVVHNHEPRAQLLATIIYAGAVSAAFFVLLAHDRPFIGEISVGSQPIAQVLAHPD